VSGQIHDPAALPRERAHGTHWVEDWVGDRDGLDAMRKTKIPSPHREENRRRPARSLVTTVTELPQLLPVRDL